MKLCIVSCYSIVYAYKIVCYSMGCIQSNLVINLKNKRLTGYKHMKT